MNVGTKGGWKGREGGREGWLTSGPRRRAMPLVHPTGEAAVRDKSRCCKRGQPEGRRSARAGGREGGREGGKVNESETHYGLFVVLG